MKVFKDKKDNTFIIQEGDDKTLDLRFKKNGDVVISEDKSTSKAKKGTEK